jgi:hypothetical protein
VNSIIISRNGEILEALAGWSLEVADGQYVVRNQAGFVTKRAALPKGATIEFESLK